MTFEEFWNHRYDFPVYLRCTRSEAEAIWNAAKEDNKPIVNFEYVPHFYGGVDFSFWQIVGKDFKRTGNFKTKQQAKDWALQNGYRVVE